MGWNFDLSDIKKKATETFDTVSNTAVNAADALASSPAGQDLIQKASETTKQVTEKIAEGQEIIKKNSISEQFKQMRIKGFIDGCKQGMFLAKNERYKFYYAYVASLSLLLRCDGEFAEEEETWLRDGVDNFLLVDDTPELVKTKVDAIICQETITFDEVKSYLNEVSLKSLSSIAQILTTAVELDGEVTEAEKQTHKLFSDYIYVRTSQMEEEDDERINALIVQSAAEYGDHIDRINAEFKERVKLQGNDLKYLVFAMVLQTLRIVLISWLTEVEKAGPANKKEKWLHDKQKDIFRRFEDTSGEKNDSYKASLRHIIDPLVGVPYDIVLGGKERNIFGKVGSHRGANHRFATLGHDPVLGLVFGTANIMTNTITTINEGSILPFGTPIRIPINLPKTYFVDYSGKCPIISKKTSTVEMLEKTLERIVDRPEVAAAALIKQLIHIGTDLYTPLGIQLPFANLVLDKAHTESLTRYVNTGDIIRFGAQAGLAAGINWLIATLHGCQYVYSSNNEKFSLETYQARTKKILLISESIVTSSSIIYSCITNNPRCLDLGGAAVLMYRLFTDVRFITRLKEEYLTSSLSDIYDQRINGILE
nr:hypothetical protein [Olegusella massiliensis]